MSVKLSNTTASPLPPLYCTCSYFPSPITRTEPRSQHRVKTFTQESPPGVGLLQRFGVSRSQPGTGRRLGGATLHVQALALQSKLNTAASLSVVFSKMELVLLVVSCVLACFTQRLKCRFQSKALPTMLHFFCAGDEPTSPENDTIYRINRRRNKPNTYSIHSVISCQHVALLELFLIISDRCVQSCSCRALDIELHRPRHTLTTTKNPILCFAPQFPLFSVPKLESFTLQQTLYSDLVSSPNCTCRV